MTREEQIVKAAKDSEKQMGFGEGTSSYGIGFITGAAWADEHPDLYSVTRKAVERERKHLIDEICEWLEQRQLVDLEVPNIEKFISDFRKDVGENNNDERRRD